MQNLTLVYIEQDESVIVHHKNYNHTKSDCDVSMKAALIESVFSFL